MTDKEIKVAILDMNNNTPNEGMRCIKEMLEAQRKVLQIELDYQVFDVRHLCQIPDLSFDIYISTGGPGSPFDGEGSEWENGFFELVKKLWQHNLQSDNEKKYMFFICHSFQLMCRCFDLGNITQRKEMAFGVAQVEKTVEGKTEPLFALLENDFYVADFRSYQITEPNNVNLLKLGAKILTYESATDAEKADIRAMTSIRLSPEMIGTQFHPEADPDGMYIHFQKPEKRELILDKFGEEKYLSMLEDFENPTKIFKTHNAILPGFLKDAIDGLIVKHTFSV